MLASNRIKVRQLRGRSFQAEEIAKKGDSTQGMVYGEYTVEFNNQEAMARIVGV